MHRLQAAVRGIGRIATVTLAIALLGDPASAAPLQRPPVPGASGGGAELAPAQTLDASIDQIVKTLEDDQQRTALVDSLKKLQAARRAVDPEGRTDPGGLLGMVTAGVELLQDQLASDAGPREVWRAKVDRGRSDLSRLIESPPEPRADVALRFVLVLGFWAVTAFLMIWSIERVARRFGGMPTPSPHIRTGQWLVFLTSRVAPWSIALGVAVLLASRQVDSAVSIGRAAGLVVAYSWVGGAIFAALSVLLFSLFSGGHRRRAAHLLLTRPSAWTLFAAGALSAFADAMRNPKVVLLFGADLADLAATAANLLAAITIVVFVLRFRRPVEHLLRNRVYDVRRRQRFVTQLLQAVASLWHVPVLLLVTVSAVVTLASPAESEWALRQAIVTALLIVIGCVATALITRPPPTIPRRSRYADRFFGFARALVALVLWAGVVEAAGRIWGFSTVDWLEGSPYGQRVFATFRNVGGTLLVAWFVWIVVDTAIHEAIAPVRPRRGGRMTSTRALTVLPLVRNMLFIVLLTLGGIATLSDLGVNVAPLLAGAGVVGLAIGFGAQTLVKDLITGVFILVEDAMSIGDWVTLDGKAGEVESLTIRTVRLRDGDGALHSIPFSSITTIKNHSKQFGYAIFNVRITYESDVDEAIRLIREAAVEVQHDALVDRQIVSPLEVWGLDRFEPDAVVLQARIKTMPQKQSGVARAFNRRLKEKFDASQTVDFASTASG